MNISETVNACSFDSKQEKTNVSTMSSKGALQDKYLKLGELFSEVNLNHPWEFVKRFRKKKFIGQKKFKLNASKSHTEFHYPLFYCLCFEFLFHFVPSSWCTKNLYQIE